MARRSLQYQWTIVPEAEWSALPTTDDQQRATSAGNPERRLVLWLLKGALLLGLTMVASSSPPPAPHAATAAVLATVQLEHQALRTNKGQLLARVVDRKGQFTPEQERHWAELLNRVAPNEASEALLSVEPLGELMLVQMLVNRPDEAWWRPAPYREHRFYRATEQGWVRTLPDESFWGQPRSLETPHLRFEFRERDAAIIFALTARMEEAFLRLNQLLALSARPSAEKLTFAVVPDQAPEWGVYGNRQRLTSPWLAKIPPRLSNGEYLAQQIVNQLTFRALNQALAQVEEGRPYRWRAMLWSLGGVLSAEALAQRSPWQLEAAASFRAQLSQQLPLQLNDMTRQFDVVPASRQEFMQQYMAAESLMTYAITTYGEASLPALLRGMGRYRAWAELVPAVYHVSAADFEAGWNQYLVQHYSRLNRLDE